MRPGDRFARVRAAKPEDVERLLSCSTKNRYRTIGQARDVAKRRQARGGDELAVYECKLCRGYHLCRKGNLR